MALKKLLFVYNAKKGVTHMVIDFLHKTISPGTYQCNLCAVTYGMFTERSAWRNYRQKKGVEMKFFYKDEFAQLYDYTGQFPVVLEMPGMNVLLKRSEINGLKSLDQLLFDLRRNWIKVTLCIVIPADRQKICQGVADLGQ